MELSIFLAKVLGLYLLILALAALLNRKHLPRVIEELSQNLALVFMSGAMSLILGLLLVLSHNVWTSDWRVIITLVGWLTLIRSVGRVPAPGRVASVAGKLGSGLITPMLVVFLLLGAYLTYVGFTTST